MNILRKIVHQIGSIYRVIQGKTVNRTRNLECFDKSVGGQYTERIKDVANHRICLGGGGLGGELQPRIKSCLSDCTKSLCAT